MPHTQAIYRISIYGQKKHFMCVCGCGCIWREGDCGVVYSYKSIYILYKYISAVLRLIACNRKSQSNSINGKLNQISNLFCPIVLMFVFFFACGKH